MPPCVRQASPFLHCIYVTSIFLHCIYVTSIQALLSCGAVVSTQNNSGETPIDIVLTVFKDASLAPGAQFTTPKHP